MPADTENVRLSGYTGSNRRTVRTTRLTHTGSRALDERSLSCRKYWGRKTYIALIRSAGGELADRGCPSWSNSRYQSRFA